MTYKSRNKLYTTTYFHALSMLLPALLILAGCGGGEEASTAGPGGSSTGEAKTVIVDGSSTVLKISKAVQEAYSDVAPDVRVVVDNHGTGGGFSRYLQGEVDVVDASRDAEDSETAKAKAQGIEWTRFLIAYDGITLVVNLKNDFVKAITAEQLKKLWEPGSKIKTWKELDPSWPDRKIVLYSPDNDSGTFEFFTEAVVKQKKKQREDVQQSSDDNSLVRGVAGDPDGIGYFGYAYYFENKEKLRALPVQNGAEAKPILPTPETVLDKSYSPLSRPLYIFVKNSALRRPEVSGFVKYYLENAKKFAEKVRYVPCTSEDVVANAKAFTDSTSGSPSAPATGAATAESTVK